jgi:predicted nucleotidyltransferase component of viral defense system
MASFLDLAATKVKAVQDRAEAKDYIDVSRILEEGIDLSRALGAAAAVYGRAFNPLLSLKALSYLADGDLSSLSDKIQSRLTEAVGKVDPEQIPDAQPRPGGITP